MSQDLILRLEEISLNAWPSLQTVYDDGWILRFADGYTGRANSVNPLYASHDNLDAKITRCEAWYQARGLPTTFKMTPASQPPELDQVLARRGYALKKDTQVKTAVLDELPTPHLDSITLAAEANEDWLRMFSTMRGVEERYIAVMKRMLHSIIPSACYATLWQGNAPAAIGMAVVERGAVGLFDIVTEPQLRNRGLGRQIILHLLKWGRDNGANQAYLQVMSDNAPALHLYDSLGFRDVYAYWYRIK